MAHLWSSCIVIGAITAGLLSGGAAPAAATSYESISTITVGAGGASSIEFTSIPSTYKHLQVRMLASFSGGDWTEIKLNGDTGANYTYHYLQGNGSAASAGGGGFNASGLGVQFSTQWGGAIIDVLDYTNTNKLKTVRNFGGYDANGSGFIIFSSNLWNNTAAVTSLKLQKSSAGTFQQYSSFALYGIKG